MPIGSQAITAFKIGGQDVSAIYAGSTLVFTAATAPIITATTAPKLGPLTDGDQVQDAYTAGTGYASTANGGAATIVSTDTVVTINGSVGALTDAVSFEDVVSVIETVTDSEGNERAFFAGTQTVQAAEAQSNVFETGVFEESVFA